MALFFLVWMSVISLSLARPNSTTEKSEHAPNNKTTSSSQKLSSFSQAFLDALTSEKIFDKIFDDSFCPKDVAPEFYSNSYYFAWDLGFKQPEKYSAKVAAASRKAFDSDNMNSLQYFKVFAKTMETFFRDAGLEKKFDQKQLIQSYAKSLKEALKSVEGTGPKAGIKALANGSVNMFKTLGKFTAEQVKSILEIFTKEMNKIH